MVWRLAVVGVGGVLGLLAGVLAPVVFVAACVWDGRMEWSVLAEAETAPYLAVLAGLGLVNGVVGARDGLRSDLHRLMPVAWAPGLLVLFPVAVFLQYPWDSKSWGPVLLMVAIVAPFVWVAGRVGQEVGVRASGRTTNRLATTSQSEPRPPGSG